MISRQVLLDYGNSDTGHSLNLERSAEWGFPERVAGWFERVHCMKQGSKRVQRRERAI